MKSLYCGRCKILVMDLVAGSTIRENTEALCDECSMIRRGAELMLKDNADTIKALREEIRLQNKMIVTGSYV